MYDGSVKIVERLKKLKALVARSFFPEQVTVYPLKSPKGSIQAMGYKEPDKQKKQAVHIDVGRREPNDYE